MKKTLNILAFLITVLVVSLGACLSANAEVQTGSCGDNVSYTLDTQTGELVISGQGEMTDYPYYGLSSYNSPFYSNLTVKSVVIKNGVKQRTCNVDGYVDTASIPATGHSYTQTEIAPTCTEDGYVIYECTTCGDTYMEKGEPATGHKEIVDYGVEPTCTKSGLTEGSHCAVCQEVIVEQKTIPVTGHTAKVINQKDATCTENGYSGDKVCSVCQAVLETGKETPKLGHTVNVINKKDATCTEDGYSGYKICSVCNEVFEVGHKIDKLGHDFSDNAEYCKHGCDTKNSNYVVITTPAPEPSTEPTSTTSVPNPTLVPDTTTQPQPATSAPATVTTTQATTVPTTTVAPATTTQVQKTATPVQTTQATANSTTKPAEKITAKQTTKATTKTKEAVNKKQKKASIKKATPAKASLTITWAKVKGVKGYEIQLATDKKFKKNLKKVTIKKQKTTKTTVKKLKAKKTYYVRIRTYKTKKVNGKSTKVYSSWSKVKAVKTK